MARSEWEAAVREFVRDRLYATAPNPAAYYPFASADYRWQHTLGVAQYATDIAAAEGADHEVVLLAALFHDSCYFDPGYQEHCAAGAQLVRQFLSERGADPVLVERVAVAVRDHAGRGAGYWRTAPLEVKVLVEADVLDKIGPHGVICQLLRRGHLGDSPLAAAAHVRRELLERAEKSEILFTPTARRLAMEKLALMRQFMAGLDAEVHRRGCT